MDANISTTTTSGDMKFWEMNVPCPVDEIFYASNNEENQESSFNSDRIKIISDEAKKTEANKREILQMGFKWSNTNLFQYCTNMNIKITRKLYVEMKGALLAINSPMLERFTYREGTRDETIRCFLLCDAFETRSDYFINALLEASRKLHLQKLKW